jgi:hypothetical protein
MTMEESLLAGVPYLEAELAKYAGSRSLPPREWPAPIRDSTIHPEQLFPQRLSWCRRHRLVGVDRTSAAASLPPGWPRFVC